jgi:hypothetical protein
VRPEILYMRRLSIVVLMLTTLLAALLPLGQARCVGSTAAAATHCSCAKMAAPMAADHSCCRGHAASHGRTAPVRTACECRQLPPASEPVSIATTSPRPAQELVALLAPAPAVAAAAWRALPFAAHGALSPPPPPETGSRRSRAPPVSA